MQPNHFDLTICVIDSLSRASPNGIDRRSMFSPMLPLLATYLGHARYSDTAYYITATPELLGLAAANAFGDGGAA